MAARAETPYGVSAKYPNGDQPKVSINVREYVDLTIAHERAIWDERQKAIYVQFATIEAARIISKEEVENARKALAAEVVATTEATRKLSESRLRSEGVSGVQRWIAPSGTAMLGGALGLLGFIVAVIAILVK